jgi:hypothetical protein
MKGSIKHPRSAPSAAPPAGAVRPPGPLAAIVRKMTARHRVRVKRWRRNMSGCAWSVRHANGKQVNWIECPYPKTPVSLAIFLHEVGHHAIGFDRYKRRCEEEYHVWVWAIDTMRSLGIEPDARVHRRFELSMRYAVEKAARRGMKAFPEPLKRYVPELPKAA